MKIGIDIHSLNWSDKSGLYQYTYNLVSNLLSLDSHNDYALLSSLKGFHGDRNIASKFLYRFPGRLSKLLLETLSIPIEFIMGKIDIFHGPCFFIPNCLQCKSIVTIHDLMALRYPEFVSQDWFDSLKKKTNTALKSADAIIAVSSFTKNDIIELFNIPEERIRVIYNGIATFFRPIKDKAKIESVKAQYGVKGPYFLFVGAIEPKKNIETLIQACVILRNETIYKYPLLIVGKKAWHFQTVWKIVKRLNVEKDTIFTDVVNDDELPYLYNGAELFIFPSLFEGFGIPVIEAMACGTPVVASNLTSIPEVAGDAALLFDPLNVEKMVKAMYSVLSNSLLRKDLIEKGLERAKRFSWEKTARETLKLYQEIG